MSLVPYCWLRAATSVVDKPQSEFQRPVSLSRGTLRRCTLSV